MLCRWTARWWYVAALPLFLCACETRWAYDWGSYEPSIESLYVGPDGSPAANVGQQIQALEAEVHESENLRKPDEPSRVPPGKYAHLAYLYAMQGDTAAARRCFAAEKAAYPESAQFIDGMLGRLK